LAKEFAKLLFKTSRTTAFSKGNFVSFADVKLLYKTVIASKFRFDTSEAGSARSFWRCFRVGLWGSFEGGQDCIGKEIADNARYFT
jgi:hypothetical protein